MHCRISRGQDIDRTEKNAEVDVIEYVFPHFKSSKKYLKMQNENGTSLLKIEYSISSLSKRSEILVVNLV